MKIGIDLDNVIADYMGGFCKFYNLKNQTDFSINDFKSNNIWEIIGGTRYGAVKLVKEFYKTDFFDEIELIKGADRAIRGMSSSHDLYIITARFRSFKGKTDRFLKEYFAGVSLEVFYPGFFKAARKKSNLCKKLEIDLMIDDVKSYATACAEKGIKVLLFDKPWNQDGEMHENITRVYNWDGILEVLS